jgi:hypothetical protein
MCLRENSPRFPRNAARSLQKFLSLDRFRYPCNFAIGGLPARRQKIAVHLSAGQFRWRNIEKTGIRRNFSILYITTVKGVAHEIIASYQPHATAK